jgi:rod shape-determining protein MreD
VTPLRNFLRTSAIWIAVALIGESLLAPLMRIGPIAPDFAIIALVMLALAEGPFAGTVGGFSLGLVQDLATPHLLGLNALAKTGVGHAVGRLRGHLVYGMPLVEAVLIAVAVLAHDVLYLLVASRLASEDFLQRLLVEAIPGALYSAVIGMALLRLADIAGIVRREE